MSIKLDGLFPGKLEMAGLLPSSRMTTRSPVSRATTRAAVPQNRPTGPVRQVEDAALTGCPPAHRQPSPCPECRGIMELAASPVTRLTEIGHGHRAGP
jgi:hypothetical protein